MKKDLPRPVASARGESGRPRDTPRLVVITFAILLAGGLSACRSTPLARLCGQAGWPETRVAGGAYVVQNDEWNSTSPECITTDRGPAFTVASSSIHEPVTGDPGGYPSIFSGCSAGVCTIGDKMPIRVSDLRPGLVTSTWTTAQPRSGAYDVAYDIWFNHTPVTSGPPDGGELMVWLAHRGGSQIVPGGAPVAHVTIGAHAYTLWLWKGRRARGQISYVMDRAALSVHGLDLSAIIADAARRGYLASSSWLMNIQAGFEIWQGGVGLETTSFAIRVRG
jgi:Glycosyl hydrolase family 12